MLRVMYVQGIYQIKQIYKGKFTRVKLSVTGIDVIYCKIIMAYILTILPQIFSFVIICPLMLFITHSFFNSYHRSHSSISSGRKWKNTEETMFLPLSWKKYVSSGRNPTLLFR